MPMSRRCVRLTHALAAVLSLSCEGQPAPAPPVEVPVPAAKVEPTPSRPVARAPHESPSDDMARRLREANTPPELIERGTTANVWDDHEIDYGINPFYLRGDFEGDGRPDYLVSVVRKSSAQAPPNPRLLVLRGIAGNDTAIWLDDDEQLSTPARDGWYVHARSTKVPTGLHGKPPELQGDAIVMMKVESSMALVYWNGTRFASHWLSD
jgi:hypothetical protein